LPGRGARVVETAALALAGIDYWALGGRHDRSTLCSSPPMVHYAGSRKPTPRGGRPHGCTLVQVDETANRDHLAPTDAIRWLSQRVVIGRIDQP